MTGNTLRSPLHFGRKDKWLVKFDIKRSGRVMSGKLDEEALQEIREALLG